MGALKVMGALIGKMLLSYLESHSDQVVALIDAGVRFATSKIEAAHAAHNAAQGQPAPAAQ